jgi:2-iminoacetate synthase
MKVKDIIDEEKLNDILNKTKNPTEAGLGRVLVKALKKQGLALEEVSLLLNVEEPRLVEKMFQASGRIKQEIYGERLVFFAPLYLSNFCVNDCEYCGFHRRNLSPRKKLSLAEIREQVKFLIKMGHKRLLLEFGEDPVANPIDYVVDAIKTIYGVKEGKGEIRRVNVNIAATSIENYRKLKKAGIGTYQLFQETYHRATYEKMHNGPKADFERQLFGHCRAIEAGIDDVGLGVLFGLFDYKFETLALVAHAQYLEKKYGVGPHTISVPRFQPAPTVNCRLPQQISEAQLLKIISILRMAVPYAGIIISTRESAEMRAKAFEIGVSQTSAASVTSPGGYGKENGVEQFVRQDQRSVDEVLMSILQQGLLPSFCTACYRTGRTGGKIMGLIKSGEINELCRPNAILTFQEYLEDYASCAVKSLGKEIIGKYLSQISDEETRNETAIRLKRIERGERDLYF